MKSSAPKKEIATRPIPNVDASANRATVGLSWNPAPIVKANNVATPRKIPAMNARQKYFPGVADKVLYFDKAIPFIN